MEALHRDSIDKSGTQSESGYVSYKRFAVIIPLGKNIDTQRVNSGVLFFIILLFFKQDIDIGFWRNFNDKSVRELRNIGVEKK